MAKFNFYLGESASSLLLVILVIITEVSGSFKNLLKLIFTHHWIGKAVIITLVFILVGFLYRETKIFNIQDEKFAWNSTIISLVIILLFFIIHYLA